MQAEIAGLYEQIAAIAEKVARKDSARDHMGTVTGLSNGKVEVLLDGAPSPTPCETVASAHAGDRVLVNIDPKRRRAVVKGNITAPATDDSQALVAIDRADVAAQAADDATRSAAAAQEKADAAAGAADDAVSSASRALLASERAETLADRAQADATAAHDAAAEAKDAAAEAKEDAATANRAANGAVASLSTVQKVVETLERDVDDLQVHVAMMDAYPDGAGGTVPAGLHVVLDDTGYFLVISNDGVYVYDDESVLVSKFGEESEFYAGGSMAAEFGKGGSTVHGERADAEFGPTSLKLTTDGIDWFSVEASDFTAGWDEDDLNHYTNGEYYPNGLFTRYTTSARFSPSEWADIFRNRTIYWRFDASVDMNDAVVEACSPYAGDYALLSVNLPDPGENDIFSKAHEYNSIMLILDAYHESGETNMYVMAVRDEEYDLSDYVLLYSGEATPATDNLGTVRIDGDLICRTINGVELKELGKEYVATSSETISASSIDSMTEGASVTLPKGTYAIAARWNFHTADASGARKCECAIAASGKSAHSEMWAGMQRVVNPDASWCGVQAVWVGTLNTETQVSVYGSTTGPYSTAAGTMIRAVAVVTAENLAATVREVGVSDYEELTSKPSIEGVELDGDKSFPDLKLFDPEHDGYVSSDKYAMDNADIFGVWNAVFSA